MRTDSTELWLPMPEVDRIAEEPAGDGPFSTLGTTAAGGASITLVDRAWGVRRMHAGVQESGREWTASILRDDTAARDRWRPALAFRCGRGGCSIVLGEVAARGGSSLLLESAGLARRSRRPRSAQARGPTFEPSASLAAPALAGAAMAFGDRWGPWWATGQREDGARLILLGTGLRPEGRRGSAGVAVALEGARLVGSVAGELSGVGASTALEVLISRGTRAALFAAECRTRPLRLAGRWRYRSRDRRPVASELEAAVAGRAGRARLSWRTWSADADADDGRIEVEAHAARLGPGPLRIRVGQQGVGEREALVAGPERFAVSDWTLAAGGGRSLGVFGAWRAASRAASRTAGTSVGGRIDLTPGAWGRFEFRVEASRIGSGSGAAAWGSGFDTAGAAELRSRSRSGVSFASRGALELKRARLRYAAEWVREHGGGERPTTLRLWLEWGALRPDSRAGAAEREG